MRLLVIEDEKNLAGIIKKGLEENGFVVELSHDGEEGLYMAETYDFDAVILDIMLPGIDGIEVLRRMREHGNAIPVLMLTARGDVGDRVKGLNLGADDYMPKPFDFAELLARVRAIVRRSSGEASPVVVIDDLEVDMNSHEVTRGDAKINLSANEYRILEYFILNRNRVISRSELIEHVYAADYDLDSNVIDVYINYLRNKIDRGFAGKFIHTVRGAGYIWKG